MEDDSCGGAAIHRIAHRHADVVVVGAGIFGAAMAVTLARQSRSVFLLERSLKEPDRIVGELLQPGGVQALERLGLRHCLDGIDGIAVRGYQVFYHGRPVTIPYPPEGSPAGGKLRQRPEGLSFHHGRFVRKLRDAAAEEPNITLVETEVNGLVKVEGTDQVLGVKASTAGKHDYFFAPLTIIADGYRSKFRGETSSRKPTSKSKFWALELRDVTLPSPGFGHVMLGNFSPVLLYQIGTHETRVLINVPEGLAAAKSANGGVSHYIRHDVLPYLPTGVQGALSQSLNNGRLRCMPNSFLPAVANRVPGLIIAGDALNMRHPLTGGGMTVALSDVALLSDILSPANVPKLDDTQHVLRQMEVFHWRRKRHSFVINILAQALYSLFAAEDYYLEVLRRGCFEYFTRGGTCVDGPAGLLGGIIKEPAVLVYHFFSVVLLSIWIFLCSRPVWRLPLSLAHCGGVLLKACWVLFPYIAYELAC
ncbi:hypothetical protein Purlil1_13508 [Purpureocillium lilacinum]|uniref:Squalene monooxygenase n=1 Tax=Purpureocillium lilacinum TaxID=33203 RepID=A0ABR0BDT4_PURLI|nr:hypothetical protein Purlil1_13508 [Purpureocillium lilacinum]